MTTRHLTALALVAMSVALGACATPATTKTIELPPDPVQLTASSLPGYAKAKKDCVGCHSAEYMLYQPPTAPRPYWEAMVKRMKAVFRANYDDGDVPELVEYLVKTYGAERGK